MALRDKAAPGKSFFVWRLLGVTVLVGLVIGSAVSVVYAKYKNRVLFEELQNLRQEKDRMDVEWGQLLLEQSTWSTHGRVEGIARSRLGMHLPERDRIVVIRQ